MTLGGAGRYFPELLGYFARFSASKYMQFRFDFFFRIGMDVIYYIINISFYRVLFLHTQFLAGWSEPKMMVFVSGYLLIDAITMTLFTNNQWMLPTYVNRGDLDYYLIRPVSSLFFLSLRDIAINSFVNLVMAAGIMVWAIFAVSGARFGDQDRAFSGGARRGRRASIQPLDAVHSTRVLDPLGQRLQDGLLEYFSFHREARQYFSRLGPARFHGFSASLRDLLVSGQAGAG